MRHRLALIFTVIGAIALPIVMAATVLYASDAAIGDAGRPLNPQFGAQQATAPTTPVTTDDRPKHRKQDDHGGTATGGDDHGGGSTSGSTSGGSGSSGSSGGSDGGSSHGGDDSSGRGSSGHGSDD